MSYVCAQWTSVPGTVLVLIWTNFLNYRTSRKRIIVLNAFSFGIPQGAVLGPFLSPVCLISQLCHSLTWFFIIIFVLTITRPVFFHQMTRKVIFISSWIWQILNSQQLKPKHFLPLLFLHPSSPTTWNFWGSLHRRLGVCFYVKENISGSQHGVFSNIRISDLYVLIEAKIISVIPAMI